MYGQCVGCGRKFVGQVEHCDNGYCELVGERGAVDEVHGEEPGAARAAVLAEWGLLLGCRPGGRAGNN